MRGRLLHAISLKVQNLLILLAFFLTPTVWAGEELYTLQVDHWENRKSAQFSASAYEGRKWDLYSLLARGRRSLLLLAKVESNASTPFAGHSYCLFVAGLRSIEGGSRPDPSRRAVALKNLMGQLRNRQAEMIRAGAQFKITYPSNCASQGIRLMPAWIANAPKPSPAKVRAQTEPLFPRLSHVWP